MATQPPLPPPPLPPLPLDVVRNSELSLVPTVDTKPAQALASMLTSVGHPAVVVGVIGDSDDATTQFANRLLGRQAFTTTATSSINIRMFYDAEKKMILLLGLCHKRPPSGSTPPNSVHDSVAQSLREQMQMQLLLYSSSHVLFVVHDHARVSTSQTQHFRSLSNAKHQHLNLLKPKPSSKQASKPSFFVASHFAPGRCVPLTSFVFPVDGGRKQSRPQVTTFCKALETRLQAILKPLRGGTVATIRAKDAVSSNNISKERRLFVLDPTHGVVAVPRKVATDDGCPLARMAAVFASIDVTNYPSVVDLKQALKPLDDEDSIGMPQAIQFATKCVDLLTHDAVGKDLLPLGQWIQQFKALAALVVTDDAIFTAADASPVTIPAADLYIHGDETTDTQLTLMQAVDVVGTFAQDQCIRECAAAIKRYKAEKPEKINRHVHDSRVQRTIAAFHRNVGSVNPFVAKYTQGIIDACNAVWHQGRRLCDATSISNRPCVLLYHDADAVDHTSGCYVTVACACGASVSRLPDAFSTASNHRDVWVLPCCAQYEPSMERPESLPILRLGQFDAYDPFQGFGGYPGFISKFSLLSPWWLRSGTSDASAVPQAATPRSRRHARKPSKQQADTVAPSTDSSPHVLVAHAGLEYECAVGHRYFYPTPANSQQHSATDEDTASYFASVFVWPGCEMAIYVQCFHCSALKSHKQPHAATEFAQMRRVYAAIPPSNNDKLGDVSMNLVIHTDEQDVVFAAREDHLAPDTLLCFTLPYVFATPSGSVCRHGDALKLQSRVLAYKRSGHSLQG